MRRLISIPLMALYVLASIGLHGVSHFCGDELVTTNIYEVNDARGCGDDIGCSDEHSCCSQPESKTECCSDVQFIVFFESESVAVGIPKINMVKVPAVPVFPSFLFNSPEKDFDNWVQSDIEYPIPPIQTPLYIQHQSLIFYG